MTAKKVDIQTSIADAERDLSAFHKDQPRSLDEWDRYRERSDRLEEQKEARARARGKR